MFNNVECKSEIKNEIPFKQRYGSFSIDVNKVQINEITDTHKLGWLKYSHKEVIINEGEFIGVVYNGMSGLLKSGYTYGLWIDKPDHLNRYIEIVLIQREGKVQ